MNAARPQSSPLKVCLAGATGWAGSEFARPSPSARCQRSSACTAAWTLFSISKSSRDVSETAQRCEEGTTHDP